MQQDHLVLADMGCRNTVFNASAQSGVHSIQSFLNAGIDHYRIELVDEPPSIVADLVQKYQMGLTGQMTAEAMWAFLEHIPDSNGNRQGVHLGSMEVKKEMARSSMKPTAR